MMHGSVHVKKMVKPLSMSGVSLTCGANHLTIGDVEGHGLLWPRSVQLLPQPTAEDARYAADSGRQQGLFVCTGSFGTLRSRHPRRANLRSWSGPRAPPHVSHTNRPTAPVPRLPSQAVRFSRTSPMFSGTLRLDHSD